MAMMIIMFAPVFALALFLVLPFWTVLPVYIPILIFGIVVNFKMMKSMKLPVKTGLEEMIGQEAVVIDDIDPEGKVRFKNEIWTAMGNGRRFEKGRVVKIIGARHLVLVVGGPEDKNNPAEEAVPVR